jgi:hypothetical protein
MKLQRREKILAWVAGGLTVLTVFWLLLFSGGSSYDELSVRRDQRALEVEKKQKELDAATVAARRLAEWRRRALPSDVTDAGMNYQAWLRELADRLQFQQAKVESAGVESRSKTFTLLKYTVHGHTNLAKLTEFLYEFYSAGHLHQIRLIDVAAVSNSPDLDVRIDVEAMSLPDADRKSKLTAERGKTLGSKKPADYSEAMVKRNMFSPPRPTPSPPDAAASTFVTAILAVEGRGEVWLVNRGTSQDWQLHEGEQFNLQATQATVKSIGKQDVVIEIDGRPCRFHTGDSLRGGEQIGSLSGPGMKMKWPPKSGRMVFGPKGAVTGGTVSSGDRPRGGEKMRKP